MKTIQGPGIFLAQFAADQAPFNNLNDICGWVAGLGYTGIQIPTWETRFFDLEKAAESQAYCHEILEIVSSHGLRITELSTHLQGQMMAVHPAYDTLFAGFVPEELRNNPNGRTEWAVHQLTCASKASQHLGLSAHATFSGSLMWHLAYPWPQRPAGLIEEGFKELAKRWTPILNLFDECGVDVCFELHPGEDLFDGLSYELFLDAVQNHLRACLLYDPSHFVLQQLDYLRFIDDYHDRIKAFHVKDAEFKPTGKCGVYGGFADWKNRAGRFRSPGDGVVDFRSVFSKLTQYGYDGWAVMEWECCLKSSDQGAKEGAPFIQKHIIEATQKSFDDFAEVKTDKKDLYNILGLNND